jgi:uncharacterized repeat protein (TIGR01451 family)
MKTIFQRRILFIFLLGLVLCQPVAALSLIEQYTGLSAARTPVLSEDGLTAYVLNSGDKSLKIYNRDASNGKLSLLASKILTLTPWSLAVTSGHVYVGTAGSIEIFPRVANGNLGEPTRVTSATVPALQNVRDLAVGNTAAASYLFAVDESSDAIIRFSRNASTGALTNPLVKRNGEPNLSGLDGANALALDSVLQRVYVTAGVSSALTVFDWALTPLQTITNATGGPSLNGAADVTVDSSGNYVYVSATNAGAINVFQVQGNNLNYVTAYTAATNIGLSGVQSIMLSPNGNSLYALSGSQRTLSVYSRSNDGSLTFGERLSLGTQVPSGLSMDSQNYHLYVTATFSLTAYSTVSADLALTVTAPNRIAVQTNAVFTMKVTNNGPHDESGVVLRYQLPSQLSYVSAVPDGCTPTPNLLSCALGALAQGASTQVAITLRSPLNAAQTPVNAVSVASVSGNLPDTITFNNSVTLNTSIVAMIPEADLSVSLSDDIEVSVNPGKPVVYTAVVKNNGPNPTDNVRMVFTPPASATYVGMEPALCSYNATQNTVTCNFGYLLAGSEAPTVNITVTAPNEEGPMIASATVSAYETDSNSANDNAEVSTLVEQLRVDMAITAVTPTPTSVDVAKPLSYVVAVANHSTIEAEGVVVTHIFNPTNGVEYISSSVSGITPLDEENPCQLDSATSNFACALGNFPAHSNASVTLNVRPLFSGTLANRVEVSSINYPERNPADNSFEAMDVEVTGRVSDLVITLEAQPNPIQAGTPTVFNLTLVNNGPDPAEGVVLRNQISGLGVTLGITEISSGTCGGGTLFECQVGALEAGASITLSQEVRTNANTDVVTYTASATQTGTAFDPNTPNTTSLEVTATKLQADVGVTLSASPNPAATEGILTFTAIVTNHSTDVAASGVSLLATLPAGVLYRGAEAAQGGCIASGSLVNCSLGTIAPGTPVTVLIHVMPTQSGGLTQSVSLESISFDPVVENNQAEVQMNVVNPSADLQLSITESADPAQLGGELVYTISVHNAGPSVAPNTQLSGILPSAADVLDIITLQGECRTESSSLLCDLGTINNDDTVEINLRLQPNRTGVMRFAVNAESDQLDPNIPNTASIETTITEGQTLFFVESLRNNVGGVSGLGGAIDVALSPDGANVYAAGFLSSALAVFQRNSDNGRLSFVQALINGSDGISGLNRASGVTVSEDGRYVYAVGAGDNTLHVFSRNSVDGSLSPLQSITNSAGISGLEGVFAITSRGAFVYTASIIGDSVNVFRREESGQLSFVESHTQAGDGKLDGANAITVSPDGTRVYVTLSERHALAVFSRDPGTGRLQSLQVLVNGSGGINGLTGANDVISSPDGAHVYVAAKGESAIVIFRNNGGNLEFVGLARGEGNFVGISGLALSGDGVYLYAAANSSAALGVFRRDPDSGLLHFNSILRNNENDVRGLGGITALTAMPGGGGHVYAAAVNESSIAVFRPVIADLAVTIQADRSEGVVGEALGYIVRVTNNGPDAANFVMLENTLPANASLVSALASQGSQCTSDNTVVRCPLSNIPVGGGAEVLIVVKPSLEGDLVNSASVSAREYDPIPTNNSATLRVAGVGVANLKLLLRDELDPVTANGFAVYTLQVLNEGPNTATEVVVTNKLPLSTSLDKMTTTQGTCSHSVGVVTCELGSLMAYGSAQISLTVKTTEPGTLRNDAEVRATQFDRDYSDNKASETTAVVVNIINSPYDNTGKILYNHAISQSGSVTGGAVAGTIVNQGLLQDVTILSGTFVSGGGTLKGTIINQGVIENASLAAGTVISGGVLRGVINGDNSAPALIEAQVAAGARLSYVIIGTLAQIDPDAIMESGVRFRSNDNIPPGLVLDGALNYIREPVTGALALNLGSDVVIHADSLLTEINRIPGLGLDGIYVRQELTGHLSARHDVLHYSVIPVSVRQAAADAVVGVYAYDDQSIVFITPNRREILAQPALAHPGAFQTALNLVGLRSVSAARNGALTVPANQFSYVARPLSYAYPAPPGTQAQTFSFVPVPQQGFINTTLIAFNYLVDGLVYQQLLPPVAADQEALIKALSALPDTRELTFWGDGTLSYYQNMGLHRGLFDYVVYPGTPPLVPQAQFLRLPDHNSDGEEERLVMYPDGRQQMIFWHWPQPLLAEMGAIPALAQQGYRLETFQDVLLLFAPGDNPLHLLRPGLPVYLGNQATPGLIFNQDGSVTFVTTTGQAITAQGVIGDLALLQQNLSTQGYTQVRETSTSHISAYGAHGRLFLRPDSALRLSTRAPGLYRFPGGYGVGEWYLLVFDTAYGRREQWLYPASPEPEALLSFLRHISSGAEVSLNGSGLVQIGMAFRGVLDYSLTPGGNGGNLQLDTLGDINRDNRVDYRLSYSNGEQQIIYGLQ